MTLALRHSIVLLALLAPVIAGASGPSQTRDEAPLESPALREFSERVRHYAELHRRVERLQPPPRKTDDAEEINGRRRAFADSLRLARPDAKQGDIFTSSATAYFRHIIRATKQGGSKLVDATQSEQPVVVLRVNDEYSTHEPLSTVPPLLLRRLPPLPEEVEYRFVGQYLLLLDRQANLIIDFFRYAPPVQE